MHCILKDQEKGSPSYPANTHPLQIQRRLWWSEVLLCHYIQTCPHFRVLFREFIPEACGQYATRQNALACPGRAC